MTATRLCDHTIKRAREAHQLGRRGELFAAQYLVNNGYEILARNARFPDGEIDIIAKRPHRNERIFVEVKTRSSTAFGLTEAFDARKFRNLRKAAMRWLEDEEYVDLRFDLITIVFSEYQIPQLEWFQGVDQDAC